MHSSGTCRGLPCADFNGKKLLSAIFTAKIFNCNISSERNFCRIYTPTLEFLYRVNAIPTTINMYFVMQVCRSPYDTITRHCILLNFPNGFILSFVPFLANYVFAFVSFSYRIQLCIKTYGVTNLHISFSFTIHSQLLIRGTARVLLNIQLV